GNAQRFAIESGVDKRLLDAHEFALGKWPERLNFDPASERVRHPRKHEDICRACEEEPAGNTVAVDFGLDRDEEFRGSLHLVDNNWTVNIGQEARGIDARGSEGRGIIQRDVLASPSFRNLPDERAFAGLTRTVNQDYRSVRKGGHDVGSEIARKQESTA